MRARADRIDLSLTVWRNLASRIERGDPGEAARASLELCALRLGATAGIVQRWDGSALRTLAWQGEWSASQPRPRDIFTDRTAITAVNRARPATISQIENACADDSDVAAPILDGEGRVIGIIALLISSALGGIFGVALYHFALEGQSMGGFTPEELESAVKMKRGAQPAGI